MKNQIVKPDGTPLKVGDKFKVMVEVAPSYDSKGDLPLKLVGNTHQVSNYVLCNPTDIEGVRVIKTLEAGDVITFNGIDRPIKCVKDGYVFVTLDGLDVAIKHEDAVSRFVVRRHAFIHFNPCPIACEIKFNPEYADVVAEALGNRY